MFEITTNYNSNMKRVHNSFAYCVSLLPFQTQIEPIFPDFVYFPVRGELELGIRVEVET